MVPAARFPRGSGGYGGLPVQRGQHGAVRLRHHHVPGQPGQVGQLRPAEQVGTGDDQRRGVARSGLAAGARVGGGVRIPGPGRRKSRRHAVRPDHRLPALGQEVGQRPGALRPGIARIEVAGGRRGGRDQRDHDPAQQDQHQHGERRPPAVQRAARRRPGLARAAGPGHAGGPGCGGAGWRGRGRSRAGEHRCRSGHPPRPRSSRCRRRPLPCRSRPGSGQACPARPAPAPARVAPGFGAAALIRVSSSLTSA